ncbi:unnamed protein product [Plutella xylostella]|uniref:(diamondback moth) hypothetical protein n=1 Tax=Plutella xylostella TaxID=51655 RepID=A0A8S4GGK9_PLUXY|nr:unnamed protein product [Plutella xylostella]
MTNPSNLETSKGNNHKDRLAQLCKKRATIKGKLTLFKNYIATISASPTLSALEKQELELRLNKVDSVNSEYDMFQTEIETMSEDFDDESDESLRERQLFEIQYYGAVSAARQLLQPVSSVSTSTSSCAGSGSKPSIVKLPQISLPHFNVKAVHLELVTELTKEAYLSAMSRFVARRGLPHSIMSDQVKCFIAADKELQSFLQSSNLESDLAQLNIKFLFTPAYSPHFNGITEAAVKSTKYHLRRILKEVHFTYEEMYTYLTQIEAILNSRPITPLSSSPLDLSALTPSHFLIGRSLTSASSPQIPDVQLNKLSQLNRFDRIQTARQHFWLRFSQEYVTQLQQRNKWKRDSGTLKPGTLVLIKDRTQPPLAWPLGRIQSTYPGSDGISRVADIKTRKGTMRRAFNNIVPLPIEADDDDASTGGAC